MNACESSEIPIAPNARLIEIIAKILDTGVESFTLTKPVFIENRTITQNSERFLTDPDPEEDVSFSITKEALSKGGIITSLRIPYDSGEKLAGNFLSLYEEYSFIACSIIVDKVHEETVNTKVKEYAKFSFDSILKEGHSFILKKKKESVEMPPISEETAELIFILGTYCYLNRKCLDQIYDILISFEETFSKALDATQSAADKETAENLLLLIGLVKYHIYRLHNDKDKSRYFQRVKNDISKESSLSPIRLRHITYLLALITGENYNFENGKEIVKEQSSKAAMAAIETRNLSHNLGSHVLSYLIQNIKEWMGDEYSIVKLSQYLQHRMDFLAEVTTGGPVWEMSMDFEEDILKEFIHQEIILKYICHSEGIQLAPGSFDYGGERIDNSCKRVSIPNGVIGKQGFYSLLENFLRNAAKHYKNDKEQELKILIELKIPRCLSLQDRPKLDGITKCTWDERKKCLIFNTDLPEFAPLTDSEIKRMYLEDPGADATNQLHIRQNKRALQEFSDWQKNYIELRIWDTRPGSCGAFEVDNGKGGKEKRSIVEKLRNFIDGEQSALIDDEGRIKPGGWGIKEMRIAANFLRKYEAKAMLNGNKKKGRIKPPLMEVLCGDPNQSDYNCISADAPSCSHEKGYENRLGFRFYLRRPKDLLLIAEGAEIPNNNKFQIERKGEEELFEEGTNKLKSDIPHRILLVEDGREKTYLTSPYAPCRVMTYKRLDDIKLDDNYYLHLYKESIKQFICCDALYDFRNKLVNTLDSPYQFDKPEYAIRNDDDKDVRSNNIVFEDHPEELDQDQFETFFQHSLYFQPVSGAYSTKSKLRSISKLPEPMKTNLYLELIESALTKVIIVDERICEWAKGETLYFGRTIKTILMKMRILVIDINPQGITCAELESNLRTGELSGFGVFGKDLISNAHFFVIHQGVLDKLGNDARNFIEKVNCRWKVIDSGRGVPHDLYGDVRFVEISALQHLLWNYDKHGIVQVLFSVRRPSNDKTSRNV